MQDTIIKGTGNSRSLKIPAGSVTVYQSVTELVQAMESGNFPIDIGPLNLAGLQQKGTDLTKANLLTDALCTALGLATTATPTQAMEKILAMAASAQSTANEKCALASGYYTGTGMYGVNNPNSLSFSFAPKVVAIVAFTRLESPPFRFLGGTYQWIIHTGTLTTSFMENRGLGSKSFGRKSDDGKTVYWYNATSPDNQFNEAYNTQYHYFALG